MLLHVDSPIAPPPKPEAYRQEPARRDSATCQICRDGWPRWVGERSGNALHELPEPAPMFTCDHVEPCRLTTRVVLIALFAAIAALLLYPHGGWF